MEIEIPFLLIIRKGWHVNATIPYCGIRAVALAEIGFEGGTD